MNRIWLLLAAAALALGCSSSHVGDDDAGTPSDGASGEACGPVTCDPGLVCCNASCGVCTAPGESCTTIACVDDAGTPLDCDGETCAAGELCCPGCGTERFCAAGPFCPDLDCPAGCSPEDPFACPDGTFCDYPDMTCGGVGSCVARPSACTDDCPGACGCDGETYCNTCMAQSAGVDVADDEACPDPVGCPPQDAASEGACDLFLGYAWSGTDCVAINCTCVGDDCGDLYADYPACQAAHADCAGATCGGFGGIACGASLYCDWPDASCGALDGTGTCRPRPSGCPRVIDPVCGCDGTTYDNACLAHAAGQDVTHDGPCAVPPG